jgi:CubicO group peptidase (beta-lactamase class C family)
MTPALVVLIARRGIIVLHEAFGRLDPETDAPLPFDAVFPLASITKPISAAATMALVEDGVLGLNRPITEYLPELVGEAKQAVMVHHLMTHTSGFRDEDVAEHIFQKRAAGEIPIPDDTYGPLADFYQIFPFVQQLDAANDAPLAKPPGVEMWYCNYGYRLLQEIVRRVGGKPLSDVARERVFEPLGMADTSYGLPERVRPRAVRRSPESGSSMGAFEFEQATWAFASAFSTAADMAAFGQMLLDGGRNGERRVFSAASVSLMTRNQIHGVPSTGPDQFFPEASWSLAGDVLGTKKALRDGSLLSRETFGHGGAGGVHWYVDPTNEVILAYFSVQIHQGQTTGSPLWRADLFANAAIAAIEDECQSAIAPST